MITCEELRQRFHYDSETGEFHWASKPGGKALGYIDENGYRRIWVNKSERKHRAHRLAWLYVYGKWPEHTIDHINGRKDDNRIANLRDVPNYENSQNPVTAKRNKWGIRVVFIRNGKFRASIEVNGRTKHLGTFDTPEQAGMAFEAAALKLRTNDQRANSC